MQRKTPAVGGLQWNVRTTGRVGVARRRTRVVSPAQQRGRCTGPWRWGVCVPQAFTSWGQKKSEWLQYYPFTSSTLGPKAGHLSQQKKFFWSPYFSTTPCTVRFSRLSEKKISVLPPKLFGLVSIIGPHVPSHRVFSENSALNSALKTSNNTLKKQLFLKHYVLKIKKICIYY